MIKRILIFLVLYFLRLIGPTLRHYASEYIKKIDRSYQLKGEAAGLFSCVSSGKPNYLDVGARRGVDIRHWEYNELFDFHLFEPDPVEASFLSNYYNNVHTCALSDKTGSADLLVTNDPGGSYMSGNNYASHLYSHELATAMDLTNPESTAVSRVVNVPVKRLADFGFDGPISYLKIDVQGEEVSVLKGLGNKHRPAVIRVEVSSVVQDSKLSTLTQVLIWAEENGYSLLGVAYEDNKEIDRASVFDIAIQGDILLVDEDYKTNEQQAFLIAGMLLVLGMASAANAILQFVNITDSKKLGMSWIKPKFSKKILQFKYNNAHDKRGLNN